MKKKKLAVFDIDGTIFRSSLLIEIVEALIKHGYFPASARREYQQSYYHWLDRKGSYEKYIGAVVAAFEKHLKQVKSNDFRRVAKQVVAVHKDRVYRYTRDLINALKKKDYYLLAISHSPKEILNEFCKNLGFDKVYGRVYEVGKSGKFTGKTLYLDQISNKETILRRAIEKEGVTLQKSIGVGDTESDIPFLSMVEMPICFNPNQKLYQYAKKHNWKTVIERKDVIYSLWRRSIQQPIYH